MIITKAIVAEQLTSYLNHQLPLAELVHWAEDSMATGDIDTDDPRTIMHALGRIAAADSKDFGLLWEDCEAILSDLGYAVKVQVEKAA